MELNNDINNKIEELYNHINKYDDSLTIFLTGSIIIPFIKNSHDIDIIIVVKDLEARKNISNDENYISIKEYLSTNYSAAIRIFLQDFYSKKIQETTVWSYELMYRNNLYGDFEIEPFYILDDIDKYKLAAQRYIYELENRLNVYDDKGNLTIYMKKLYHIKTCMFFIENNSYELTENQIKIVNDLHDMVSDEQLLSTLQEAKEWAGEYVPPTIDEEQNVEEENSGE